MERITDSEITGDKFQCKCGNTEFEQECYTKTTEIVNIIRPNDEVLILVAKSMKDINDEDIEHTSEFICPKCNSSYEISKKDGKDVIVDHGE